MRRLILALSLACIVLSFSAQAQFSTYYYQRATHFEQLTINSNDIVFLGNSITDGCEWAELFGMPNVKNRGISGDTTPGILNRLSTITDGKPAKIFLLIGINDFSRDIPTDTIVANIHQIVKRIKAESPSTKLYLQSILPVNDCYNMFGGHTKHIKDIPVANEQLKKIAIQEKITFIDLFSTFALPNEPKLRPELSNDGLHMLGKSYNLWRDLILPYVEA